MVNGMTALFRQESKQIGSRAAYRDTSEVGHTFPHHWDPSKYWYCEQLNDEALEVDCHKDEDYMYLLKAYIPWLNWFRKKPEIPPTVAYFDYDKTLKNKSI